MTEELTTQEQRDEAIVREMLGPLFGRVFPELMPKKPEPDESEAA